MPRTGKFSGTSKKGELEGALQKAIAAAKKGLTSEFVTWKLLEAHGADGGFADQHDLTAEIEATVP